MRTQPRWARPGLIALLALTALAYTIDLSSSGYANSFYAAAVQAGTKSRVLIPIAAVAAVCLLAASNVTALGRRASTFTALLIIVATLSGPLAYSAQTIATAHTGSIPSAGPASSGGGFGGAPGGGARSAGAATRKAGGAALAGGGAGGQSTVGSALVKALERNSSSYRWVAATSGSQSAASLELATGGEPVMAIGGFSNQGGNLSLAQFKSYVAAGDIHYYIASSGGATGFGGPGGGSTSSSIATWVKAHYKAVSIGGQTVYDLTRAVS